MLSSTNCLDETLIHPATAHDRHYEAAQGARLETAARTTRLARVVYIIDRPLSPRNYVRFGVKLMTERGISVAVIDVSALIYPFLDHDREHHSELPGIEFYVIHRQRDLAPVQDIVDRADLIVFLAESHGITRKNLSIAHVIARSRRPYLIWGGPVVPGSEFNRFQYRLKAKPTSALHQFLRKDFIESLVVRIPPKWLGIPYATYFLDTSPSIARRRSLVGPNTKRIAVHAPDYDTFLEERARQPIERDQAVFIDQFYPHHPDFVASSTPTIDADDYFRKLNALFSRIERDLGFRVVIAGHPGVDYSAYPKVFDGRPLLLSSTARLVLESKLVLAHASTAIGFAVMARKPIMILYSKSIMEMGIEGYLLNSFSQALGVPLSSLDDLKSINLGSALRIHPDRYDEYMRNYLKPPGTPDLFSWEIAINEIEENFCSSAQRSIPNSDHAGV